MGSARDRRLWLEVPHIVNGSVVRVDFFKMGKFVAVRFMKVIIAGSASSVNAY
jgi:hypothetical protein